MVLILYYNNIVKTTKNVPGEQKYCLYQGGFPVVKIAGALATLKNILILPRLVIEELLLSATFNST